MKKIICWVLTALLALMLSVSVAQEETVLYTATVTREMTIREKKSTSAKKLGSVEANEFISVIDFDSEWTRVIKDGVVGYVLTKNVTDMADAQGYNDLADAQYVGVADKELTIRGTKSRSARRMQSLDAGETVYVLELGEEWHYVVKQGMEGYVLASGVSQMAPAHEGIEMPEAYKEPEPFKAVYSAQAMVNLSIRKEMDENSKLLGTLYKGNRIDVMRIEGEWAYVRQESVEGYLKAEHLRYFKRYDPYGPYIPGVTWYPYAALVQEETEILDNETGELLRTVPAGTILAVSALDSDMAVTLPYDRITGRIQATGNLEFEHVVAWDQAQTGDLIAVFSTYYDKEQETTAEKNRLHNMTQGVERLNDVIVPQGEKFYFNDFCAPYNKANGYLEGPIINYVSDKKLGYGGGICQISTTLYDAILQIPVDVIKQQVHSAYGISYAPLDMDAAVGNGNIDLRLGNTLPYDIRFAMQLQGGVVTVRIYRAS